MRNGVPQFSDINSTALSALPAIVARLLPDGRREGHEWVARNPTRADHRLGSFKINLSTGRWCDFATADRGGDPISLVAYLEGVSQSAAAGLLSHMLGINREGRSHG